MIVCIDGPAGAGKSSVARLLAERLGFRFLDTGAMYRAVALAGMRHGVDWDRPEELARLARAVRLSIDDTGGVRLDDEDVSTAIRTPDVTERTRFAADNPAVREHLVQLQRRFADSGDLVTEGRDQGTVVFPQAECKIFLTATLDERARRRVDELRRQGHQADHDTVRRWIETRDAQDSARPVGPLALALDAVTVVTDGLTQDEVLDHLAMLVQSRTRRGRD